MQVTAILVTHNSAGVIVDALKSLRGCGIERCIVVDNASTDGTIAVAKTAWPEAEIIQNTENYGFGRANNIALARVQTEFALLINPDARMGAASLQALLATAERYPDAAILAPQLADESGHAHATYKRAVFAREHTPGGYMQPKGDLCVEFLSGAVWLARMRALTRTGFFDPAIFLYYEDDDLCLRAVMHGFSCVLVEQAQAVHLLGKSSSVAGDRFRHKHMAWSRLYLERKYRGGVCAKKLALRMLPLAALKFLLYIGSKRRARYAGRIEGIVRFLRGKKP